MRASTALRRLWIPLTVVAVLGGGAFAQSRIQQGLGASPRPSYADGRVDEVQPFNPKRVVYEVYGPEGTVADISYFDVDSIPQQVEAAPLPWSLDISTSLPTIVGSVVAQGNSDTIGCRIVVDGKVRAERETSGVDALTHCLARGV